MNNVRSLFPIVIFLLSTVALAAQRLTFSPQYPQPGEKVTVQYSPKGTALEKLNNLEAIAYFLTGNDNPIAQELELTTTADGYQATVTTPTDAKALFVVVQSDDQKVIDNNDEKGHGTLFYKEDGKTPVQGSLAAMGDAYYTQGYWLGVKRDYATAIEYYKKEFSTHAASKENENLSQRYWYAVDRGGTDENKAELDAYVAELSNNKKASEKDLMFVYNYHNYMKEDEAAAANWAKIIEKKYPKGKFLISQKQNQFYEERDVAKKEALFNELKKLLVTEADKATVEELALAMARAYSKTDINKFQSYMAMSSNEMNKASLYNNIAWGLSGESLDATPKDLEVGKKLSHESIQIIEKAQQNLTASKPPYYTAKQWKKSLERQLGMYGDTYALLLYHAGDYEGALKYQTFAAQGDDFSSPEMNERYAVYYEKVKGGDAAEELLAKLIREGKGTGKMKEQYTRLFVANNTVEEAAAKQLALLEEQAREELKKEIKKRMMDKDPIDFDLVDLNGKKVSLNDMKGKVVVLDFWATWCGPCIASFPGMQTAVNKFKERSDVAFLFIDTWEQGKEKEKNASDFIQKNSYTFHVLMDNENKAVTSYGVQGIPSKFVLDKDGRIRFESVGFNGSADGLVDELSIMVELAAEPESMATATSSK